MKIPKEIRRAALEYLGRGWAPIPVRAGSKAPSTPGWVDLCVTEETVSTYFNERVNIGIRLGLASGGLVDVDLDVPEAISMAGLFLPATDAIFGRPSKITSHWLYVVNSEFETQRFKDPNGTTLLELRGSGSQTVFPSSTHSGETVSWSKNGDPSKQESASLCARVGRLAAAVLIARHWPATGSRQETALALGGGLSRLRWNPNEIGEFIIAVARTVGDEEWERRFSVAEYTQRRLDRKLPATGWKRLETLLSADVVRKARTWLDSGDQAPAEDDAANDDRSTIQGEQKTQAQQLLELAEQLALFHTPNNEGFATVPINGHKENWPICSSGFRNWLLFNFYQKYKKPPSTDALKNAVAILSARSQFEAPVAPVFLRVAHSGQNIFIDLCNSDWEVIQVTGSGWEVVPESPVCFYRSRGMAPLPRPERGGSIDELRKHINAQDDKTWKLIVAWLLGSLYPTGPYPILILQEEAGTAKSTTARLLRSLLDSSTSLVRSAPREDRDLMIAAHNSWVLNYDNLSALPYWLSDAFCRLATGGGLSTRQLYTDMDEIIFEATRPLLLNGIDDLAAREDLADRALIVSMSPISEDCRRSETALQKQFEADAPRILGGLLNVLSASLSNIGTVSVDRLPRMADFAQRVVAAEDALGWPSGSFIELYKEGRANTAAEWLEGDAVGKAVLDTLTDFDKWEGTATILLASLNSRVGEEIRLNQKWPKDSRALAGRVRRAAPFLRKEGVEVDFTREPHSRRKLITIRKVMQTTDPLVPKSLDLEFAQQHIGNTTTKPYGRDMGACGDLEKSTTSSADSLHPDDVVEIPRTDDATFQCGFCAEQFASHADWRDHTLQSRCTGAPQNSGR